MSAVDAGARRRKRRLSPKAWHRVRWRCADRGRARESRRSATGKHTRRHSGYAKSLRIRKRIEETFGWIKGVGALRQTKLGLAKGGWVYALRRSSDDMTRRAPSVARAFAGRWRIIEMDEWDEIDPFGLTHIAFNGKDGDELGVHRHRRRSRRALRLTRLCRLRRILPG